LYLEIEELQTEAATTAETIGSTNTNSQVTFANDQFFRLPGIQLSKLKNLIIKSLLMY